MFKIGIIWVPVVGSLPCLSHAIKNLAKNTWDSV